jgi:hypothetical protein
MDPVRILVATTMKLFAGDWSSFSNLELGGRYAGRHKTVATPSLRLRL